MKIQIFKVKKRKNLIEVIIYKNYLKKKTSFLFYNKKLLVIFIY